jgi:hypothetical protein
LAVALNKAQPGDIIYVTGTCKGAITLTKHRIALVGRGLAEIVGDGIRAAVTMNNVQDVVLKHITVRNGFDGVLVKGGAAAILVGVRAKDNRADGFQIEGKARVQLADCVASTNGHSGFRVQHNAIANFFGKTESLSNAGNGLHMLDSASANYLAPGEDAMLLSINDCLQNKTNQAGHGVLVDRSHHGGSLSFGPGCKFTAKGNNGDGMRFAGTASYFEAQEATLKLLCNAGSGLSVGHAKVCLHGSTVRALKNQDNGVYLWDPLSKVYLDSDADADCALSSVMSTTICSRENGLESFEVANNNAVFECNGGARLRRQSGDTIPAGCTLNQSMSCSLSSVDSCPSP